MSTPAIRAALERLIELQDDTRLTSEIVGDWADAIAAARAALAAPEVGEIGELVAQLEEDGTHLIAVGYANESVETRDLGIRVTRAATLLSQLAAPAPAVVSVAEDLPETAYDAELGTYVSHLAPHHAIPLPQGGEGEA